MKYIKKFSLILFMMAICSCGLFPKKQEQIDFTQQALDSYLSKDYDKTIELANKALEKDQKNVKARYYLGCALSDKGESELAKLNFERILKEAPLSPEADIVRKKWLPMIEEKLKISKKKEEIEEKQEVEKKTEPPQFLLKEQRILEYPKFKKEIHQEAIKYYYKGAKSVRKGDYIDAIAFFEKAISLDENFLPPYTELGIAYAKIGEFTKAIDTLNKAITKDPSDMIAHYNLGAIYEGRGNWTQAIQSYMKVLSQDPNNVAVRTRLGICFAEVGQVPAAIDQWNIATTIDPNYKEARLLLGKIYADTGDVPFVRVRYRLSYDAGKHTLDYVRETGAAQQEPESPLYAGYLFYDAAVEQYIEALKIDPHLADAYAGLGYVFARAALRDKRLFHPEHKELRDEYSGQVRLKMTLSEMFEMSAYYLKKAIKIEPKNAYHYCNLGVVYAEMGMYESAIQVLKKAIELDSRLTAAHANLAIVYSYQGYVEKAYKDYKKIAKIEPDKVRIKEALKLLQPEIKKADDVFPTTLGTPAQQLQPVPQPPPSPPPPAPTTMPLLK